MYSPHNKTCAYVQRLLEALKIEQMENFLKFSKLTQLLSVGQFLRPEIFEFGPYLHPWQLFKDCTRQRQIFTDFEHPFSNDHNSGLEWTFSKILKPRINSLVCPCSRKRTQVIRNSGS